MISRVSIKNFMGHTDFQMQSVAPINLIIGKNDTGKSGLLKLLYTACKTIDIYSRRKQNEDILLKRVLAEKLSDTFQPGKKGLGELVSKHTREKLNVDLEFKHDQLDYKDRLYFGFGEATTNTIIDCQDNIRDISDKFRCLFIPPKEVLSSLKAIRATRDNLHIPGFDDTYLDLIKALVIPTSQGNFKYELKNVNEKLEALFDGSIEQRSEDDFVFKKGNSEFSMSLTAEGVKKIGILTTLIRNRQLNATSVLFLDEPETTLHPEATRELIDMLVLMAQSGMQIFLASHSFFVLKQLHISARRSKIDVGCYSLVRPGKGLPIQVTYSNLKEQFIENAITDESIKMYTEDIRAELEL